MLLYLIPATASGRRSFFQERPCLSRWSWVHTMETLRHYDRQLLQTYYPQASDEVQ